MAMPHWYRVALAPVVLSACAGIDAGQAERPGAAFTCGDHSVAIAGDNDRPYLSVDAEHFAMTAVPAASGARYEAVDDPATWFWNRGDHAMISVRGEALPECVLAGATAGDALLPLDASGNEPPWRLRMNPETTLLFRGYDDVAVSAATPPARMRSGRADYRLVADGHDIGIRVTERICRDSMTGMPYPVTVRVSVGDERLDGCGGDPETLLAGAQWRVETIAGVDVLADAGVTIAFLPDGRFSGLGSCNRYTGEYTLSGEGLSLSRVASTRRACASALMRQEARYLDGLSEVYRFDIDASGALVLHGPGNGDIVARRAAVAGNGDD